MEKWCGGKVGEMEGAFDGVYDSRLSIMHTMSSGSVCGEAGWGRAEGAVVVGTLGAVVWVSSEVVSVEGSICNCCIGVGFGGGD